MMAYIEMFNRDKHRFKNNLESLNENPLGVAALTEHLLILIEILPQKNLVLKKLQTIQ